MATSLGTLLLCLLAGLQVTAGGVHQAHLPVHSQEWAEPRPGVRFKVPQS